MIPGAFRPGQPRAMKLMSNMGKTGLGKDVVCKELKAKEFNAEAAEQTQRTRR